MFLGTSVGERSCDNQATKFKRKLKKSRRQAVEIQTILNSRKAKEIDTIANCSTMEQDQESH